MAGGIHILFKNTRPYLYIYDGVIEVLCHSRSLLKVPFPGCILPMMMARSFEITDTWVREDFNFTLISSMLACGTVAIRSWFSIFFASLVPGRISMIFPFIILSEPMVALSSFLMNFLVFIPVKETPLLQYLLSS